MEAKKTINEEYNEMKKLLKSLVVMSKRMLTVSALAREYEDFTGTKIDCPKFGYHTLTSMFNSMTDTFRIVKKRQNNVDLLIVELKDLTNVAHINEMVLKQRGTKVSGMIRTTFNSGPRPSDGGFRSRRSLSPLRPKFSSSRRSPSPPFSRRRSSSSTRKDRRRSRSPSQDRSRRRHKSKGSSASSNSSPSPDPYLMARRGASKAATEATAPRVNGEDRSLANKDASSPSVADPDIADIARRARALLEQQAQVQLERGQQGSSAAIPPAIPLAKPPSKIFKGPKRSSSGTMQPNGASTIRSVEDPSPTKKVGDCNNFSQNFLASEESAFRPLSITDNANFGSFYSGLNRHLCEEQLAGVGYKDSDSFSVSSFATQVHPLKGPARGLSLPSFVQRNLTRLLQKFPDGVQASQLCDLYKVCYEQDLNVNNFGWNNVEHMINAMPTVFLTSVTNGSLSVADATTAAPKPTVPPQQVADVEVVPRSQPRLTFDLKMKIESIINCFPDGALFEEVAGRFKAVYDIELNPQSFGFSSLREMMREMDGVDVEAFGNNTRIVKKKKNTTPTILINNIEVTDVVQRCVPLGFSLPAMRRRFTLDKPNHSVVVSEVYSPSHFYIQYEQDQNKLNTLMKELETSYSSNIDDLKLLRLDMNQYVVANFSQKWHRGQIIDVLAPTKARVMYIDYGTIEVKNMDELFLLIDKTELKVQIMAARAELSYVKPATNGVWSAAANDRFNELVGSESIVAKYRAGGMAGDSVLRLSLSQVDIKSARVVLDVAEVLQKEGHAVSPAPLVSTREEVIVPREEVTVPREQTPAAAPEAPANQQSSVPGRFANVEIPVASDPQALAYSQEVEMATSVFQDISRKLSTKYGERVVLEAIDRLKQQPFPLTDATTLSQMSNMLWSSAMQNMQPMMFPQGGVGLQPGGPPLLPPGGFIPQGAVNMMQPQLINAAAAQQLMQLPMNQPVNGIQLPRPLQPIIAPQGARRAIDRKPTIIDLVKFEEESGDK